MGNTQGLAIGDFNSDGKPDIATTNWGGGTVGVLLSKSGGGFTATSITTGDSWPDDIATADFNGDGKLDLVVANGFSDTVKNSPGQRQRRIFDWKRLQLWSVLDPRHRRWRF